MKMRWFGRCAVAIAVAILTTPTLVDAQENNIYTGGRGGSYFNAFGPRLQQLLEKSFFNYDVVTSAGSSENIDRVLAAPEAIGLTQADVLAFRAQQDPSIADKIVIVRNDVANECLFAVTNPSNADRLGNWGDVQSFARRLRIATGSEGSGAAATLQFLQSISEKLGQASPQYMEGVDQALDAVIGGSADIAFFVQFADPSNARFEKINNAELAFVPVVDRAMLRERVNEEKVYLPQEVKVTGASLLSFRGVQKVVTACTPLAIITGNPNTMPEGNERLDQQDKIDTIRAADVSELRPEESWFASIRDSVVEASGQSLDTLLDTVDRAAQQIR